jgi:hypothetical protein
MESKFTPLAGKILQKNPGEFIELSKKILVAVAGNAGWAPLLPGAVVEKSIDTAIEFYNAVVQLRTGYEKE